MSNTFKYHSSTWFIHRTCRNTELLRISLELYIYTVSPQRSLHYHFIGFHGSLVVNLYNLAGYGPSSPVLFFFRQAPAPAPKVALAKPPAKPAAKVAAVPKVMPAVAVEMVELEDSRNIPAMHGQNNAFRWVETVI